MASAAVGLDIGGTKILGLAVDVDTGTVLGEHRVPTPEGADPILDALVGLVDHLAAGVGTRPAAVGVGAAGLVDASGVLRFSPNLPGIVDFDLLGRLAARVGVPVSVDNDATAATVAEHSLGAARGVSDALYVALGTGIGGGMVLDGAIRRGAHGFGGEFGHMVVDPTGPLCGCGQHGCWERLASGSALRMQSHRAAEEGRLPDLVATVGSAAGVDGHHVVAAAAAGDEDAQAVIDRYARWIAVGLGSLANAYDPELIVIGGGIVEAGEVVMAPLRQAFGEGVMGQAHRAQVPLVAAAFGELSAAVGAAVAAAHQI